MTLLLLLLLLLLLEMVVGCDNSSRACYGVMLCA